jgi:SAM-dependent methyltransferase
MQAFEDRATRYETRWREAFDDAVDPLLVRGASVLDIGSGRAPTIAESRRPDDCLYVGLDVSESELLRAERDAYDEIVVADIATAMPTLVGRFDLALSWQVLEHVKPLDRAFANIHSYLRPGGTLVAQLSGKFSAFALINQLTPSGLSIRLLEHLTHRHPQTVYPAYYDRCYADALRRILARWSDVSIIPRFRGASYFAFSGPVHRLYLRYEDWTVRAGRENLATHYLVVARK